MLNNLPFVLLAFDHSQDVDGVSETLSLHGMTTQACTDRSAFERWVESPGSLDGLIAQSPLVTPSDLSAMRTNMPDGQARPAVIFVMPDHNQATLADALGASVDLPIVGEVSAKAIADAAVTFIDRHMVQHAQAPSWALDAVAWQIVPPSGAPPVTLTFREREFLLKLAQQPGQPLPKERFSELFDTTAELFDPRRLEIMVRRLRNKVREQTKMELPLHTAHGLGYALATPVKVNGANGHPVNPPPQHITCGAARGR